jgi:hypothetical protein
VLSGGAIVIREWEDRECEAKRGSDAEERGEEEVEWRGRKKVKLSTLPRPLVGVSKPFCPGNLRLKRE